MQPDEPIKVFIGADESQLIPATIHAASIWRSVAQRCPLEIYLMMGDTGRLLLWSAGQLNDAGPLALTSERYPAAVGTGFSLQRFTIPVLMNRTGRAVYCDSDQICIGDFLQLSHIDLGTAGIACCAARNSLALPETALETSVMVIDCARCNWSIDEMLTGLDNGEYSYRELTRLYGRAQLWRPENIHTLGNDWNSMDDYCAETKLIHYTTRERQPWKNDLLLSSAGRNLWSCALIHEIKSGFIGRDILDSAFDKGYLKKSLRPLCNQLAVRNKRLSVVIEAETLDLAPDSRVLSNIQEILSQLELIENSEALIISSRPLSKYFTDIPMIVVSEGGYYLLKNTGFSYSLGAIVQFIDADCCPESGYLAYVLSQFESKPELQCLTGRSVYRGHGMLSKINSTLSFGYLHQADASTPKPYAALSHNLSIRASSACAFPFGPWDGRVGGDRFLTNWYRDRGHSPVLDQQLIIHHEDPSLSVPLLLDRHLREHLQHVIFQGRPLGLRTQMGRRALTSAWSSWRRRRNKIALYGRPVGLQAKEEMLANYIIGLYWVLDIAAVLVVLSVAPVKRRWLHYQNGRL